MIPLYSLHTESHAVFFDEWFRPSLPDDLDLRSEFCRDTHGGRYRDPAWSTAVVAKSALILRAIQENPDRVFVYSDVDVQFFGGVEELVREALGDLDIVCQRDDPEGTLCTGFFAARGSERLFALWSRVREHALEEGRDQRAFNELVRENAAVRAGLLPDAFFGAGCGLPGDTVDAEGRWQYWMPGQRLTLPQDIVLHHANWTIGIENKLEQLRHVASVRARKMTRAS